MKNKRVRQENLETKLEEFTLAMDKYKSQAFYIHSCLAISVMVVLLQAISLLHLFQNYSDTNPLILMIIFIAAYIVTDFVNGLVHMYMDNNTNYTSLVGPFVSAFHLHHSKLIYVKRHPIKVYFYESGT